MNKTLIPAAILITLLAGCATHTSSTMTVAPDVRKMSYADDTLFRDLLIGSGGVGQADNTLHPKVPHKTLMRIVVVIPYDNRQTGVERWYVQHEGGDTCVYLVKMIPDGNGGTDFTVQKESPQ